MEYSLLGALAAVFAGALVLCVSLLLYPLYVVSVHTLIEAPANSASSRQDAEAAVGARKVRHTPARLQQPHEDEEEDEDDVALLHTDPQAEPACAPFITKSVRNAWSNLIGQCGPLYSFRALPAQIVHLVVAEGLFAALGGVHPTAQVATRMMSEDPSSCTFAFSLQAHALAIVVRLVLIPLDVVITRQIITKPDATTFVSLSKTMFLSLRPADFTPIVLPTLFVVLLTTFLDNARGALHFTVLSNPSSLWQIVVALLANVIFLGLYFIVATTQALVYRSHAALIAKFPPAPQLINTPQSYAGMIRELTIMVHEERRVTGTILGRLWRYVKIMLLSGALMVVVILLALVPLYLSGLLHEI